MRVLKGMLISLSLLQYISLPSFWQTNFYWFFLWILAFQILWFYLEKPVYRKYWLGVLALLAYINILFLPAFPLLMSALYMMAVREELSRKETLIFSGGFFLILAGLWTFISGWPTCQVFLLLVAVMGLTFYSVEQALEIKKNKQQYYNYLLQKNEMEEKTEWLKAQMESMEEVYTLNERNRISRDLHDSIGHTLSTIVIQLAAIEQLTKEKAPEASAMLAELHTFTKKGLANVREVIHAMKPAKSDSVAFIEQLNRLMNEFEKNNELQIYFNQNKQLWPLSEAQEQTIFRAIQEFLVNTVKHSQADEVRIQNHFTSTSLILTMQDNGEGTDKILPKMGLTGMKERAKLIGGKVHIQSSKAAGFRVRIVMPKGGVPDV